MKTEIFEKVRAVFAEAADVDVEDITPESVIMEELDITSMEMMVAISALEKEFSIRIPEKKLRYFETIEDVADYIFEQKSAAGN